MPTERGEIWGSEENLKEQDTYKNRSSVKFSQYVNSLVKTYNSKKYTTNISNILSKINNND